MTVCACVAGPFVVLADEMIVNSPRWSDTTNKMSWAVLYAIPSVWIKAVICRLEVRLMSV